MLSDKELQSIRGVPGERVSAATVLELVEEVTRRRRAFADAEHTDLDDLLTLKQRDELLQSMRDTMLGKIGPLAVGSPTVGDWRRVVDETARETVHRMLLLEVRRPPCEHDELMYLGELLRRDRELKRLRAAFAYCRHRFAEDGTTREIGNDLILECANEIATGKAHLDGSCHYPGIGGCSLGSAADDCAENK